MSFRDTYRLNNETKIQRKDQDMELLYILDKEISEELNRTKKI